MMDNIENYLDDNKRIKKLRQMVDDVCDKIKNGKLTLGQARKEAALVRFKAEKLIPFEMEKFDLIYTSRLNRMIEQYLLPQIKDRQ
jgi:hypothetical protein